MMGKLRKNTLLKGLQFLYLQPKIKYFGELAVSPQGGVKVVHPANGGKCGGIEMRFVYVLKSERKNRFYIGCTSNLQRRLDEHNKGRVRSTKAFVPWTIIFAEKYSSQTEAFKREKQLESYKSGKAFKELLKKSESWQSG